MLRSVCDMLLWHATGVVDVCLIPEVTFSLDGSHGLMAYLQRLLAEKGHCVICVAEGAGQVCTSMLFSICAYALALVEISGHTSLAYDIEA